MSLALFNAHAMILLFPFFFLLFFSVSINKLRLKLNQEKGASKQGIKPTSFAYQPNTALPLDQTGSRALVSCCGSNFTGGGEAADLPMVLLCPVPCEL